MSYNNRGKRNRTIGHDAERYYAQVFKNLGFSFCVTSRLGSRLYDNAKIDLINLPFNVQIKAGIQKSLNAGKELFSMVSMIKALFPPDDTIHSKPNFLIHKKPIGRGKKATPEHEIVYMSKKQFLIYQKQNKNLKPSFEKSFKFELNSEFKDIVAINFEIFKREIINKFFISENNGNNNTEE